MEFTYFKNFHSINFDTHFYFSTFSVKRDELRLFAIKIHERPWIAVANYSHEEQREG